MSENDGNIMANRKVFLEKEGRAERLEESLELKKLALETAVRLTPVGMPNKEMSAAVLAFATEIYDFLLVKKPSAAWPEPTLVARRLP